MDWKQLVKQIRDRDETYEAIAKVCHTTRGHIHDIGSGRTTEPKYGLGVALLALHKRVTRRKA